MSSDRPKQQRKPGSQSRPEPAWRIKRTENAPVKKFSRSELLGLYRPCEAPVFVGEEEQLGEVVLREGVAPKFQAEQGFEHLLGDDVNARERPSTKMPDWYFEGDKKPVQEDHSKAEALPQLQQRASNEPKASESPPKLTESRKSTETVSKPIKVVVDKNAVIRNLPDDLKSFNLTLEVKATSHTPQQFSEDFFTEEYSAIDREMEKRLKKDEDTEELIPEWASVPLPPRCALHSSAPQPAAVSQSAAVMLGQVATQPSAHTAIAPASQSVATPPQSTVKSPFPAASSIPLFDSRAPKFHIDLLLEQIKGSDPFAKVIFQYGVPDSEGFMCCIPLSLPLERAWFYQDPKGVVQGPFTSIEMYNWKLVGYFSPSLHVSWRTASLFFPLSDLSRAPSDFWGPDPDMASTLKPIIPPADTKPLKHTLEINPNRAINSLLGIDTTKKTASGWVAKPDSQKDSNRKR